MERCPRCHASRFRYTFKCWARFTYIAVACERCGYTPAGKGAPMKGRDDPAAAFKAADLWNDAARKAERAARPPERPRTLH